MYINKSKLKILSTESEIQGYHEDSNHPINLWVKVNIFNSSFLTYILKGPKFNGGEFSIKLKEKDGKIKLKCTLIIVNLKK
ncbi:hypothetical protein [Niallia sp. FSL R7-0271]|uniref:hypothetical protein n=1 Tax=Niallia sp. FSL R7-0271 TaxID=2921678 RepID=UPI0030F598E8